MKMKMKTMKPINARDLLFQVMQERQWYGSLFDRKTAAVQKSLLKKGLLSYEKCREILTNLGWRIESEEIWIK